MAREASIDEDGLQPKASRRKAARRRTLLAGKIVACAGAFSFDCTVRNINELGAQIKLPTGLFFSGECFLVISRLRIVYNANVVWRRANSVGLHFTGSRKLSVEPTALDAILHRDA